ncbi:uncharacterized protein LOC134854324 isoform X2 [Symsagittifera roscoffensis]|uniref:uncharacterized protein LOC134854324 isoform X2 n=1 Tax=Symsagittifera roscoffensis TaxID=84072 RepID=UPI00307BC6D5
MDQPAFKNDDESVSFTDQASFETFLIQFTASSPGAYRVNQNGAENVCAESNKVPEPTSPDQNYGADEWESFLAGIIAQSPVEANRNIAHAPTSSTVESCKSPTNDLFETFAAGSAGNEGIVNMTSATVKTQNSAVDLGSGDGNVGFNELLSMLNDFESKAAETPSLKSQLSDFEGSTNQLSEFNFTLLKEEEIKSPLECLENSPSAISPLSPGSEIGNNVCLSSRKIKRIKPTGNKVPLNSEVNPLSESLTSLEISTSSRPGILDVAVDLNENILKVVAPLQAKDPALSLKSPIETRPAFESSNGMTAEVIPVNPVQSRRVRGKTKQKPVEATKKISKLYSRDALIKIATDNQNSSKCTIHAPSFDFLTSDLVEELEAGLEVEWNLRPITVLEQEFKPWPERKQHPRPVDDYSMNNRAYLQRP